MPTSKAWARKFYSSIGWQQCRNAYLKSVGGLCERCKAKGLIVPAEEVHHKVKLTAENIDKPDIVLNWKNLEALCKDCHLKEHTKRRYRVDKDGRLEIVK